VRTWSTWCYFLMSEQARVLARSVAMIGIVVLVAVVVQNTSSSSAHSARNARIQELRAEITRVEQENVGVRQRLTYAKSLPSLREIAKRDLGLVDPGDRAIVILDELKEPPRIRRSVIPVVPTIDKPPIEFGHFHAWMGVFSGS